MSFVGFGVYHRWVRQRTFYFMNIKFRALQKNGKGFVYGHYIANNIDVPCIIDEDANQYEIIPDTVGIITDYKDKSNKEIYEWDIVEKTTYPRLIFAVTFSNSKFNISDYIPSHLRVIGNIHENPGLLTK